MSGLHPTSTSVQALCAHTAHSGHKATALASAVRLQQPQSTRQSYNLMLAGHGCMRSQSVSTTELVKTHTAASLQATLKRAELRRAQAGSGCKRLAGHQRMGPGVILDIPLNFRICSDSWSGMSTRMRYGLSGSYLARSPRKCPRTCAAAPTAGPGCPRARGRG